MMFSVNCRSTLIMGTSVKCWSVYINPNPETRSYLQPLHSEPKEIWKFEKSVSSTVVTKWSKRGTRLGLIKVVGILILWYKMGIYLNISTTF